MRNAKSTAMKLVLSLVGLAVMVAVVELAVRLAGPPPASIKETSLYDRSKFYFASDMERLRPWIRDTNRLLRVAIVGDSFTNGQGVQPDDTFGMRLERLLNLKADALPATVDIFAKGGTSTYMQRNFVQQALEARPDLLVLAVYLNDTEDFTRHGQLKAWREEMLPPTPPRWLAGVVRRSAALGWVYRKIGDRRARRGFQRYYERLYEEDYSGWRLFRRAVEGIQEACAEQGVPMVVAVWPCLSLLDRDPYPFQFAHDRIAAFLQERGIRHLDWLDSLRGRAPVRMEVLPGVDGHPSEIAHRIAAEALFHYLLTEGLVDASYIPRNEAVQFSEYWEAMYERMSKAEQADVEPAAPTQ